MKRLLGVGLVAVMAVFGANTASAVYSDAIGIAFQQTALSSSTMAGSYLSQDNWISVLSTTDTLTLNSFKSDNGVTYGTLGGNVNYWHDGSGGNDPIAWLTGGTLPANFGMAFATGTGDPSFTINNVPFTSYDVALLTASMDGDGWNDKIVVGSEQWTLFTSQSGSTFTSAAARDVGRSAILAIQFLSNDAGTGTGGGAVPEPGTVLLLGGSLIGLVGGAFRRFVRK